MSGTGEPTVVIADYDYGDVEIERMIIEGAGFGLVAAQCKSEDDVVDVAAMPTRSSPSTPRWAPVRSTPSPAAG